VPIDFSPYQAVLLDLDGTVFHEDHPLPGAVDLIGRLQREGRTLACLSNSGGSPLRMVQRLAGMGADLEPDQVYTAAAAACDYVAEELLADQAEGREGRKPRIYNLATESVMEMLRGEVDWVQGAGEPCDAVISAAPSSACATPDRQRVALALLRKGAALVAICADRVFPSPRGLEFGSGALAAMLTYASGVKPVFCGKPERFFFVELCRRLDVDPEGCVLIGDNLESDIAGARAMGMQTILTLSGVTRRRDLLNLPAERQPHWVIEDLREA
jgi:HAD superfamily hydrolase (TIGR01450 family)